MSIVGKFPTSDWIQFIRLVDPISIVGKIPTLEWHSVIHGYDGKSEFDSPFYSRFFPDFRLVKRLSMVFTLLKVILTFICFFVTGVD